MKRITFLIVILGTCLASAAWAQGPPRYTVQDLGTLDGGTYSYAGGISNDALVAGSSTLSDGYFHAFLSWNGWMLDLGTLGGPNSQANYRPSVSGEVGGISDTTITDPNGEDYCGFGTYLECHPFSWQNGVMTPLPLLGGNNGYAAGVNNWGQVAGAAEYNTPDPTCTPPLAFLRSGAVVWENGKIIEKLPALHGDPDSTAYAINDKGQATGASTNCSSAPVHALLWQDGRVTNLGSLGGAISLGGDINNQGQVVGFSLLADNTTFRAFLWQKSTGMIDLGTLPGDVSSDASGINNLGQVAGGSYDADGNNRAYLWQNGVMTDLNTLIPPDSPLYLMEASGTINDWGQIAGYALQISTGEVHAFLATPTWGLWPISERAKVVLPENVRKLLQQRRSERFRVALKGLR